MADANYWKNVNLEAEDLPADINRTAAKVQVNSKTVNIMVISFIPVFIENSSFATLLLFLLYL